MTSTHTHQPSLDVIVCTFALSRLDAVLTCLFALARQSPPPARLIVVVDHNDELCRRLRESGPPGAIVVANPGPRGLSHARNAGLVHAESEVVAFVDDDAVPEPGWLSALRRPFEDRDVAVVGGHAQPSWEGEQPAWLPAEYLWVVGCSYRGLATSGPVRNPLGCNMAFRAELFAEVGGFDPALGRLGSRPLGCEETELCLRVRRRHPAAEIMMVQGAAVRHAVGAERARPSYFLSRCLHEGVSKALIRRLSGSGALATERGYLTHTLVRACGAELATIVRGPGRTAALARVAAIPAGVACAAAGYALGVAVYSLRPPVAQAEASGRL